VNAGREYLERLRRQADGHGMDALFYAMTAMQAGTIWLNRSFPTQDGPIQLYYADVLADLLRGGGTYTAYFRMNNHSPVYCFFNYALVLLNQVFSPLTSERVLVSLYVVAFSLGVRFLVRSVEPRNEWLPFFLMPFAFHTYLYLGIYNFSLGVAVLLFAMGVWLRAMPAWTWKDYLLWIGLLLLVCSIHPMTLAFLGLFLAGHLTAVFVGTCRATAGGISERVRAGFVRIARSLAAAGAFGAALLWISTFSTQAPPAAAALAPVVSRAPAADRLRCLLQMVPLCPYFEPLYRFVLLLLVLLPLSLLAVRAARATWKPGPGSSAATFALGLTGLLGLGLFVFGPPWFLSAGYFADRMSVIFVLGCLIVLSPLTLPPPLRRVAVATAVFAVLVTAVIRDRQTAVIVKALAPVYDAKPLQEGGWGAIVSGTESVDGLTFNPYYWAGAHHARESKAILLNTPWIYGPLAVLTPRATHPWDGALPDTMRRILSAAEPAAASRVGFVCGGKWDPSHQEMASSAPLARGLGLVRIFESDVSYCDGKPRTAAAALFPMR
jgi:hypothetical protein